MQETNKEGSLVVALLTEKGNPDLRPAAILNPVHLRKGRRI